MLRCEGLTWLKHTNNWTLLKIPELSAWFQLCIILLPAAHKQMRVFLMSHQQSSKVWKQWCIYFASVSYQIVRLYPDIEYLNFKGNCNCSTFSGPRNWSQVGTVSGELAFCDYWCGFSKKKCQLRENFRSKFLFLYETSFICFNECGAFVAHLLKLSEHTWGVLEYHVQWQIAHCITRHPENCQVNMKMFDIMHHYLDVTCSLWDLGNFIPSCYV